VRNESEGACTRAEVRTPVLGDRGASSTGPVRGPESEQKCWDPKGGELCLGRAKPGETLVEVRRNTDVQIVSQTWV